LALIDLLMEERVRSSLTGSTLKIVASASALELFCLTSTDDLEVFDELGLGVENLAKAGIFSGLSEGSTTVVTGSAATQNSTMRSGFFIGSAMSSHVGCLGNTI
jgi:hypothetical protein